MGLNLELVKSNMWEVRVRRLWCMKSLHWWSSTTRRVSINKWHNFKGWWRDFKRHEPLDKTGNLKFGLLRWTNILWLMRRILNLSTVADITWWSWNGESNDFVIHSIFFWCVCLWLLKCSTYVVVIHSVLCL